MYIKYLNIVIKNRNKYILVLIFFCLDCMVWENKDETEYNLDVSYMSRLNIHLQSMGEYSTNQDFSNWLNICRNLFRELSPEFSKEEQVKIIDELDILFNMVNEYVKMVHLKGLEINKLQLMKRIEKLDLQLRQRMKDRNLQGRYKQAAGDALG